MRVSIRCSYVVACTEIGACCCKYGAVCQRCVFSSYQTRFISEYFVSTEFVTRAARGRRNRDYRRGILYAELACACHILVKICNK